LPDTFASLAPDTGVIWYQAKTIQTIMPDTRLAKVEYQNEDIDAQHCDS
jgi:hypothetical protein